MIQLKIKEKIDALDALKPKELKAIGDKFHDNEKHLKEKEVFNEISNEMIGWIYNISKELDFNNLTYRFKGPNIASKNFIEFKGPMDIYNDTKMVID